MNNEQFLKFAKTGLLYHIVRGFLNEAFYDSMEYKTKFELLKDAKKWEKNIIEIATKATKDES